MSRIEDGGAVEAGLEEIPAEAAARFNRIFNAQDAEITRLRPENAGMREALSSARETILDLKNARWSEAEGTDEEWVAEIDAALSKASQAEGQTR